MKEWVLGKQLPIILFFFLSFSVKGSVYDFKSWTNVYIQWCICEEGLYYSNFVWDAWMSHIKIWSIYVLWAVAVESRKLDPPSLNSLE